MKIVIQTLFFIFLATNFVSAQWEIKSLQSPKGDMSAAVIGPKIYFAGGRLDNGRGTNEVEVYDFISGEFEQSEIPYGMYDASVIQSNDWAMLSNGAGMIVGWSYLYNQSKDEWEIIELEDSRGYFTPAAYGDEAFYFGGERSFGGPPTIQQIDIYNVKTKEWRKDSIPFVRTNRNIRQIDNKLFFIGGLEGTNAGTSPRTKAVDIYNFETQTWDSLKLSVGRTDMAIAVAGNKLIAAGGHEVNNLIWRSDVMDIIDLDDYSVTSVTMPEEMANMRAFSIGNKVIFVGGNSKYAHIFNLDNNSWENHWLTLFDNGMASVRGKVLGSKLYLAGGSASESSRVFIYDSLDGSWEEYTLPTPRFSVNMEVIGNRLLIGGGFQPSGGYSSVVDIYTDTSIPVNFPLTFNASATDLTCNGDASGSISSSSVGGNPPYQFQLSTGEVNDTGVFENLPAGDYIVTVMDGDGTELIDSIIINEPEPVVATVASKILPTDDLENGEACISATGGTGDYYYNWSRGGFDMCKDELASTIHMVTVTDDNRCKDTIEVELLQLLSAEVSFLGELECYGDSNAMIRVFPGGRFPWSYEFSNGLEDANGIVRDLKAGTYSYTLTDGWNRTFVDTFEITQPDSITVTATIENPTVGNTDGKICINFSGGTAPYSFRWTTGSRDSCIEDLVAQTYTVVVDDANDCRVIESYELTEVVSAYSVNQGIQFEIFPVPANEKVSVKFDRLPKKIMLVDLTGKILFTKTNIQNLQMEFRREDFSSGLFFLLAEDVDGFTNLKKLIFK